VSVREKIKICITDKHGNEREVEAYYPKEWICAYPPCNKVTNARQRLGKGGKLGIGVHCSCLCRVKHQSLLRKQEAMKNE